VTLVVLLPLLLPARGRKERTVQACGGSAPCPARERCVLLGTPGWDGGLRQS
jgi:hypothetical protein